MKPGETGETGETGGGKEGINDDWRTVPVNPEIGRFLHVWRVCQNIQQESCPFRIGVYRRLFASDRYSASKSGVEADAGSFGRLYNHCAALDSGSDRALGVVHN